LSYLKAIEKSSNYIFVQGDIARREQVEKVFQEFRIDGVVHFAAESHVDNSIRDPEVFVRTNVMGTFTLLDVAYRAWFSAPKKIKPEYENSRFLHISTDEVFGSLGATGYFTEETPYAPNSPYSASKAGSDYQVRAYHHTFGVNTVITNCSNNFGPHQHQEKLIPTVIRTAVAGKPIPIYGQGKNIRDWLFVEDHARAIALAFERGRVGETYNVGASNELTNLQLTEAVCKILDEELPVDKNLALASRVSSSISGAKKVARYFDLVEFVTDRPGHDFRYAIDASKIKKELGWFPAASFEESLRKTVRWYLEKWGLIPALNPK
jgi:dTDP-glucose 4,6-dehydratase